MGDARPQVLRIPVVENCPIQQHDLEEDVEETVRCPGGGEGREIQATRLGVGGLLNLSERAHRGGLPEEDGSHRAPAGELQGDDLGGALLAGIPICVGKGPEVARDRGRAIESDHLRCSRGCDEFDHRAGVRELVHLDGLGEVAIGLESTKRVAVGV